MKISSFETRSVDLTSHPAPIAGTPGEVIGAFVTLKLRTDEGVEGVGYAGFVPPVMLPATKAALDGLTGLTVGMDAMEIEKIQAHLLTQGGFGSPGGLVMRAASAVDVALWDIRGKALGQPVWKLLGGFSNRVPTYASGKLWRQESLDELPRNASALVEQGFRGMKMRMGAAKTEKAEIERLHAIREAIGPDIDLMVDINQGWDANRAISVGRELERQNMVWFEDPVHFEDYAGLRKIADALDTPVCAGEYAYGIRQLGHMLEAGAVDILMIDLLRAGGLTGWMKASHLAESFNVPVVTHLAPEILAHGAAAVPNAIKVF